MLDKFLCRIKTEDANRIEFPSEKEAIAYCKENGIDPHNIILKGDKYMLESKKQNKALDKAISVCDADIKYNLRYIDKHGDEHAIKFNTESEMKAKAQQAKLKGMENIIAEIVENGSIRKSYKLS